VGRLTDPSECAAIDARLQRCGQMLERQRKAREDAEAIAEDGLRRLYLRQQRSELLQRVATVANLTSSAEEAYARAIEEICTHTGCVIGNVFLVEDDGRTMRASGIHQLSSPDLLEFIAESRRCRLAAGVGLPGRVLETREACYVPLLADDENFLRLDAAQRLGLVSAMAFPVIVGAHVNAVLEFYSAAPLQQDAELLETLTQIGLQLGRVVERERFTRKLTHDAQHDALTGLPNKVQYRERLEAVLSSLGSGEHDGVAVMFMDLDGFKLVNDSAGHHSGDQLLIDVAHTLGRTLSDFTGCDDGAEGCLDALLARFGGDEFTVLLWGPRARGAAPGIAQALLSALERLRLMVDGITYSVSSSIGIAYAEPGARRSEDLMRNADLAMYDAKRSGRGRITVFGAELHQAAQERFSLQSALGLALERREFELHYQPIVSLNEPEQVCGFEALLRWRRGGQELLPPSAFIDLAEEIDLIGKIGEFVMAQACRQAARWSGSSAPYVSVNVSPKQFKQDRFCDQVEEALVTSGLAPDRLRLEVTENIAIRDPERARATLHRLRDRGVRVSLDDFGTGYSSLSHLHRFPFEALKIDRSFVTGLSRSPRNQGLVRAILDLAQTLDLEVVAEGVEREDEAAMLRVLGCPFAQGHRFGRPMAPDLATQRLAAARARSYDLRLARCA